MKRPGRYEGGAAAKINVTPMIDVVMCLIIFFLIVGKLAAERNMPLDLPDAPSGAEPAGDPIVVNVATGDGGPRIVMDRVELSRAALVEALRASLGADPERPVVLRASRKLVVGDVRPVLEACREAGVRDVRIAGE